MDLKIKQAHITAANKIRRAQNGSVTYNICEICPTAQALMELDYENVCVGLQVAKATGHRWDLPQVTFEWIIRWTGGDRVYPITLVLVEEE